MTDIALLQLGVGQFGVSRTRDGSDLLAEDGLETAVILSLFSDARAASPSPDGSEDPRGWWGDIGDEDGVRLGSLIWTLFREKVLPATVSLAITYCRDALQWMIRDGIARAVNVTAERGGLYQISIGIEIIRPLGESIRYAYLWDGQLAKFQRVS